MGSSGRTSLARVLLLSVVLSGLALGPRAAPAGAVDNPRTPPPGSATLPVRGPVAARAGSFVPGAGSFVPGAGSFVPGRVLVGFEAGTGERGRRTAAAAVAGQVEGGSGRTRVVELDRAADVRAAARRLAARPDVAFAEPDWIRRVETAGACDPAVCWHLQPRPGADVVQAHTQGHRGEAGPWPWSTPGWPPGWPTWPGGWPSAGAATTPAACHPPPPPPAPTAPRWPASSPPSTTAPAPPASPRPRPSSPTGSSASAASPSPTCTGPWPGSPPTPTSTWST